MRVSTAFVLSAPTWWKQGHLTSFLKGTGFRYSLFEKLIQVNDWLMVAPSLEILRLF